ncbi:dimethyl sulfoxide reductase anchor subunit family protein [Oricola cellulosilytica]|uniref:DMSO reductase n=1 Tax=Oricola cellulosilytica TaxID=1429082 RepID=A0A4V2MNW3_9HYPH|nr:DmsC/YnfH family molybdoenzyme membrane anchor subunit [Oricola cellulosilytica]TCD14997.1 DMSO reductase [Oricola cellulosilytica]
MHPAYSVIFFTVVSGMGYGLAFFLGIGLLDPATMAAKAAYLSALGMIGAGLISSTFHLKNPHRAWRAFSQWRSSWLSREGVMAILTFIPLTTNAALCVLFDIQSLPLGIAGTVGAAITVYSTAMIYASLRTVDAWHTRLTPACYLAFAALGGTLWTLFFDLLSTGSNALQLSLLSGAAIAGALALKLQWRARVHLQVPNSTPETATGLGHIGAVRLLERPHVNDNYLTREMGFRIARKHAAKLFRLHLIMAYLLPIIMVTLVLVGLTFAGFSAWYAVSAGLSLVFHTIGMFVERWLFFAEARHAVMNYYGG